MGVATPKISGARSVPVTQPPFPNFYIRHCSTYTGQNIEKNACTWSSCKCYINCKVETYFRVYLLQSFTYFRVCRYLFRTSFLEELSTHRRSKKIGGANSCVERLMQLTERSRRKRFCSIADAWRLPSTLSQRCLKS